MNTCSPEHTLFSAGSVIPRGVQSLSGAVVTHADASVQSGSGGSKDQRCVTIKEKLLLMSNMIRKASVSEWGCQYFPVLTR